MKRIAVDSSVLRSIGYDAKNRLLEVEFDDGDIYHYFGVPRRKFADLLAAESHGEHFNLYVKPAGYRFEKIS